MGPRFLDLEGVLGLSFKIERGHSQLFQFFSHFVHLVLHLYLGWGGGGGSSPEVLYRKAFCYCFKPLSSCISYFDR